MAQNGFVVNDEQAWERFIDAYAWIYWKDLPVLITTDSILHAIHQSYDDLLQDLERDILAPRMLTLLQHTRGQLQIDRLANDNAELEPIYEDVALYLDVAFALLEGKDEIGGEAQIYLDWALAADAYQQADLFGNTATIDFTLFKPRGHYASPHPDYLHYPPADYFRAMSWLAHVDFRFVSYNPITAEPELHKEAIAAALALREAIDGAGQRQTWDEIDGLLAVLAGSSDNMTFAELDSFALDAGLSTPASALSADAGTLLRQLEERADIQQQITGQIVSRHIANSSPAAIPRPISFMMMGQRFILDAYIMGNLVYDRLLIDGHPVERALPDPLDVAYALGNDRAIDHLANELGRYGYEDELQKWRNFVDDLPPVYWQAPSYNQWLQMIRALNANTGDEDYPQTMQTAAWADKMLQTQLASWTQLRHDNILYAKQSFTTAQIVCEFPDAYVEPYPEFYAVLADYAASGQAMLSQLEIAGLSDTAIMTRSDGLAYFEAVLSVAERLGSMAEKELRGEALSDDDMAFIQNTVVRHVHRSEGGCGGPRFYEEWDGWYRDLFYKMDESPALIADVHTNPTNDPRSSLYPPRVLHVATGPVSPIFFILDRGAGLTLFVGPAFTYFEVIETGNQSTPPARLTDEQWHERLQGEGYPQPPSWTGSFRVPTSRPPGVLDLPVGQSIGP